MKVLNSGKNVRLLVANTSESIVVLAQVRIKYGHGSRQWVWDLESEAA